ncbi:YraN family protein [Candidatus Babeliales bacterium]|nr:YraN family protein [Candidatus Babeliales bacterium]
MILPQQQPSSQLLGQQGEQLVVQHLRQQGFVIIAQNYKQFFGEIDIIAQSGQVLAFIEVKTRKNSIVSLYELVTPAKQQKIIKVANTFVTQRKIPLSNIVCRFDVALIAIQDLKPVLTYIPNAFCAGDF